MVKSKRGNAHKTVVRQAFIRQIGDYIFPCVKKVIIKGDTEFIGGQRVLACRVRI